MICVLLVVLSSKFPLQKKQVIDYSPWFLLWFHAP